MTTRHCTNIANRPRQTLQPRLETAAAALLAIGLSVAGFASSATAQDMQPQAARPAPAVTRLPSVGVERLPPVDEPAAAPFPPELSTPVAPRPAPAVRSDEMEMIARQSDEKIREGMDLAARGASFAARADFIAALRLVAQGLDNDQATSLHSQALGAALTAMKEAQDFVPGPGKVEGELDLAPIVAGHRTPLLKNVPPERLQAMRGLKMYFTYAQEQLGIAVGHEVSGSVALAALGKIHAATAEKENPEIALADTKAIVFYQAALTALPRNYMAANDLGVLLAHKNDYVGARAALEQSVAVFRCAENLRNLCAVYRQLGELRLAEMAARDAAAIQAGETIRRRAASGAAASPVEWVDEDALAKSSDQWTDLPARPSATAQQNAAASKQAAVGQAAAPFFGTTR